MRIPFPLLMLLFTVGWMQIRAQVLTVTGTVRDTSQAKGLPSAVAMAVRLSDSVLVSYTRTDTSGRFRLGPLPVDTYQVVVSHPLFSDHTIVVLGKASEPDVNLYNIVLPPKSMQLNEVTVYGYADPVYFKGDTLVYTADSFQVKPNAVVEDLLKKLPGIKVDAQGKIYSQGKAVDKVLVDGDEFFGTDPTVATRNLNASSVESVQVYDKKNDNPSETQDDEMLKVMDLKLKEDAKKGYFGKASAGHDKDHFYEGDLLLNKFKGKQKISFYGLGSNTPRTSFGWRDMDTYSIDDQNYNNYEDGMYYSYNDELKGIPRTLKTGAYFTDMLTRSTKLSLNYTYKKSDLETESSTASKYFLPDTTYKTTEDVESVQSNASHTVNIIVNQKIDSLNDVELTSRLIYANSSQSMAEENAFYTSEDTLTRTTQTFNSNTGNNTTSSTTLRWTRNFRNRDRKLYAFYSLALSMRESDGLLQSHNRFFPETSGIADSINQQKSQASDGQNHFFSVTYTEPLNKKIKLEFTADYARNDGTQDKKTYDVVNGLPSTENAVYSNSFENSAETQRLGMRFIYEVRKQLFAIGGKLRNMESANFNRVSEERISQDLLNFLPTLTYRYKFSENKTFMFRYNTDARLPDLNQLQPVPDNSDPNTQVLGNPDLLPSFSHNFNTWMNSYRIVTGSYAYGNAYFNITRNAFTNDIITDSIGRTLSRTLNVDGNYNGGLYAGTRIPFFSRWLDAEPGLQYSISRQTNFINSLENVTQVSHPRLFLNLRHETDSLEFGLGVGYSNYHSSSSLNETSNQRYSTTDLSASMEVQLPWKFRLETEASYSADHRRSEGYNIDKLIWNATLKKNFLKNDNLVLSLEAMDMLNQNIQTERNVQDNVISDVKSNIVGRYILLKVMFKFNSNKEKDESEDD